MLTHMNTKTIARKTGLPVSAVNSTARDLQIARYDHECRCWRVDDDKAQMFLDHLTEVAQ